MMMKLKAADDVTKIHLLRLFQSHIVVEFFTCERRSGVLTGPQPPPPIASKILPQNLVGITLKLLKHPHMMMMFMCTFK